MTSVAADAAHSANMIETRTRIEFAEARVGDRVELSNPEFEWSIKPRAVTVTDLGEYLVSGGDTAFLLGDSDGMKTLSGGGWVIDRIDLVPEDVALDDTLTTFRTLLGTKSMDTDQFYRAARDVIDLADRARAAGIR